MIARRLNYFLSKREKVFRFILFCILIFSAFDAQEQSRRGAEISSDTTADVKGNTYALIVGVSNYENIKSLLYADDDAYLIYDLLISQNICTKNNIAILIDSAATRENFFKELQLLKNKILENDKVLIYFAGHGDVESDLESGYLLPYNCEANNYSASAIDMYKVEKYLNAFVNKKAQVMLITDACRSGNLAGGMNGASLTMSYINKSFENVVKILSCQPNELSLEKLYPSGGHGIFTYYLVNGLNGLADKNNNKKITLNELEDYLGIVTEEAEKIDPNTSQNPMVYGDKKAVINEYDDNIKKIVANKQSANSKSIAYNKNRGFEDSSFSKNPFFILFQDHIRNKRLIAPPGRNAYEVLDTISHIKELAPIYEDLKVELIAHLEDIGQRFINEYIRSEFRVNDTAAISRSKYLFDCYEKVEKMSGPKSLRINEIIARKLFFKSFAGIKDIPEQIIDLNEANLLAPNSAWLLNVLGGRYALDNKKDSAEICLLRAMSLTPKWIYPFNNLGLIYMDNERLAEAMEVLLKGLKIDKQAYVLNKSMNRLGCIYGNSGKITEALKCFSVSEMYYSSADSYSSLVRGYALLGQYSKADSVFNVCNEKRLNHLTSCNNSNCNSSFHIVERDWVHIFDFWLSYREFRFLDSSSTTYWYHLGRYHEQMNNLDSAIICFKKSIDRDIKNTESWMSLTAACKSNENKFTKSTTHKAWIHQKAESAMDFKETHPYIIQNQLLSGDIAAAEKLLFNQHNAVPGDTTSESILNHASDIFTFYKNLKDYAKAEKYLFYTCDLKIKELYCYYRYSLFFAEAGKYDLSLKYLELALKDGFKYFGNIKQELAKYYKDTKKLNTLIKKYQKDEPDDYIFW